MRGCVLRHARSIGANESSSNFGTGWAVGWVVWSSNPCKLLKRIGRGDWIRTTDLLVPNLGRGDFVGFWKSLQILHTMQPLHVVYDFQTFLRCTGLYWFAVSRCTKRARKGQSADSTGFLAQVRARFQEMQARCPSSPKVVSTNRLDAQQHCTYDKLNRHLVAARRRTSSKKFMTNVTRLPKGCSAGIRTAKRLPSGAIVTLRAENPAWSGTAIGDQGCGAPV